MMTILMMTIMMMTTMTSLTQAPMQVAQTRLEKRSHRTENENCNDAPHIKIVEEVKKMRIASFLFCQQRQSQVGTIQSNIEHLNGKLAEAQEAKQDLLAIKHKLEQVILSVDILQGERAKANQS